MRVYSASSERERVAMHKLMCIVLSVVITLCEAI
jgi:hypothetical protein